MIDRGDLGRFEHHVDGHIVFANYRQDGKTLTIHYVEAPQELRGSGAAGQLMTDIAEHARANGYKIVPVCGYAAAWLRRHEERYGDLVDD